MMKDSDGAGKNNTDSGTIPTAKTQSEIVIPFTAATTIEKTPFFDETTQQKRAFDVPGEESAGDAQSLTAEPEGQEATQPDSAGAMKISCHACGQKLDVSMLAPFAHINCPSCETDLIIPRWFDNYLLEEPIGAGGMASVYRALDLALDREVAIKILNPDVASEKERSELFLHEARTAATINHYAVIPIYTCGEFKNQPFIVMQYMSGGTVENTLKLERKGLPLKDVVRWVRDIAEGLDNARRHGIIHHDIKPGNIMLDSDRNAKIGDFGIAQALNDARTSKIFEITKAWVSPHYVSPEKVVEGKEGYKGDIYSLGAAFYHMITGFTPFDCEDVDGLIKKRLQKDPIAPHHHSEDIPLEISRLVMSMMARDADDRPSYRDIVKILNTFMKKGRKKTSSSQGVRKTTVDLEQLNSAIEAKTPSGSFPFAVVSALLLALAVVGVFAWKNGTLKRLTGSSSVEVVETPADSSLVFDYIPEASAAFARGDVDEAERIAKNAIEEPGAGLKKRKQAGIQLAFANYLNNYPHAVDNCSFISERLTAAGIDESDPYISVIRFLERSHISPDALKARLADFPELMPAGNLAVFLRQLYSGKPVSETGKSFVAFSLSLDMAPDKSWMKAWSKRLKDWKDCIVSGKAPPGAVLERLISLKLAGGSGLSGSEGRKKTVHGKSVHKAVRRKIPAPKKKGASAKALKESKRTGEKEINISALTPDWFLKNRAFASKRPPLKGFKASGPEFNDYFRTLPETFRQAERRRARLISSLRDDISGMLSCIPFDGSIELNKGGKIKGLLINTRRGLFVCEGPEKREISWDNLSFDQYIKTALFIIEQRGKAILSGVVPVGGQYRKIARMYMKLGILCDWMKKYSRAVDFIKKSVKTDRGIEKTAREYIL